MDRIFDTRTIKEIKLALSSMSGKLDELYREALIRIRKQAGNDGQLGMRILSWITHAKRPLSVDELRYGLAVEYSDVHEDLEEFDEDNLLSPGSLFDVCAGLVIIDPNSQVVRLVHYTTQEYFDKERLQLFKGAEVDISRACLTYLSYSIGKETWDKMDSQELIASYPFLDYACNQWFLHANNVLLSGNPDPSLVKVLTRFKGSDSITMSAYLLYRRRDYIGGRWLDIYIDRKKQTFPYEVASKCGLKDLLDVLLDPRTGPYPNLDSSLVFASFNGHLDMANLLLQNGAAIDAIFSLYSDKTISALEAACGSGYLAVAEFLIENGAKIHGRQTSHFQPLHFAAINDHPDIIDLLLGKGVNVNARNSVGETACHIAAWSGNIKSVRRLIDAGCDLELRDNVGYTVLLVSADRFHDGLRFNLEIVDLLLDRGANACATNKEGKTLRSIIEDVLKEPNYYPFKDTRLEAERMVEVLRQAEKKSSTTVTNDPQQTQPSSSAQTVSYTSTSLELRTSQHTASQNHDNRHLT